MGDSMTGFLQVFFGSWRRGLVTTGVILFVALFPEVVTTLIDNIGAVVYHAVDRFIGAFVGAALPSVGPLVALGLTAVFFWLLWTKVFFPRR